MVSYFKRKILILVRRLRSVPAYLLFLFSFPFLYFVVLTGFSNNHFSMGFYILVGLTLLVFTLVVYPRSFRTFRRKTVSALLSGHICPHCGYSLLKLPYREDGFISCPECNVVWQLPEYVQKPPIKMYRFMIGMYIFVIILVVFFIVVLIAKGKSVFSSDIVTNFLLAVFYLFILYHTRTQNRKDRPFLVMGDYHESERGNCPACHVVMDGVAADWDGVTTCSVCGAVWKVADFAGVREFSEPTKFCRAYLMPTWVVDGQGKSVVRLRAKNDWMEFIIQSLMKKRCPGCSCSLADVEANDEGLVVCPGCAGKWVLPSGEDVRVLRECGEG